jgi:hypothetical protein
VNVEARRNERRLAALKIFEEIKERKTVRLSIIVTIVLRDIETNYAHQNTP